jgi:hypothetical protein
MGATAVPFENMWPDMAGEIKRAVFEYVEVLKKSINRPAGITGLTGTDDIPTKGTLEIHSSGYPVAPRTNTGNRKTRKDLEPLYRMYITEQYRKS